MGEELDVLSLTLKKGTKSRAQVAYRSWGGAGGGEAKEKKGFCPRGSRWDASLLIL